MGRARVAVHALAQMVLLRELEQPGFGDIHSWNIDDYFHQWVQSLRSEYFIKRHAAGAPRNRYACCLRSLVFHVCLPCDICVRVLVDGVLIWCAS